MKRLLAILLVFFLLCLCGCNSNAQDSATVTTLPIIREGKTVGISLPEDSWLSTASALTTRLENAGYQTILEYAQGDPKTQADQITAMADKGVACIIVTPVDAITLAEAIDYAASKGVKLVAYDRLPTDTKGISYYVAPDYRAMGAAVAEEVTATLQADKAYTFELFMGNPTDPNARLYWEGVVSVLRPYMDKGMLQNRSARLEFEDVCITDGSAEMAEKLCAARLNTYYADAPLDICIAGTDTIAGGIIAALENAGYTEENWPAVTGSGCYDAPVAQSKLFLSAYTAIDKLCEACVAMVDAALSGNAPAVGKSLTGITNNAASVPTYLCDFTVITVTE